MSMYARDRSKTPTHGSQTPMYENGSRTPHYGLMTLSHNGLRIPGHSGVWDPAVINIPARTNDSDGYSMEECDSPGYAPGYPPTGGPFTAQTLGTTYGLGQSFSSYQPIPSPVGNATTSPSLAGYVATPSPSETEYTTSPHRTT
ncbi:transcription elongation factor SPT5 [Harpegnathos saltator]|nr:transcription elongation factor SPT5 [Harpegnathos saltator]